MNLEDSKATMMIARRILYTMKKLATMNSVWPVPVNEVTFAQHSKRFNASPPRCCNSFQTARLKMQFHDGIDIEIVK